MDYRKLLEGEFFRRREANPRYSMRAFARDLGISSSFLSQLLSRTRFLSCEMAAKIARNLHWTDMRATEFVNLVHHDRLTADSEVEPQKADS